MEVSKSYILSASAPCCLACWINLAMSASQPMGVQFSANKIEEPLDVCTAQVTLAVFALAWSGWLWYVGVATST